jgi:large subunit ribosomal protein L6
MSRIGKKPIDVPAGVTISVAEDNTVTVKGSKGELSEKIHKDLTITQEGNILTVIRPTDNKLHRSLHGLSRTLIANMVIGVSNGFEKKLEINGVGYRAAKQGNKLALTLGFSHPVEIEEQDGITFDVPEPTKITVKGIDKQKVGAYAAHIRSMRPPEPYKGKGVKYIDERIIRKEGKSGAK